VSNKADIWIIDTNDGQRTVAGPFSSIAAAESHIVAETKEQWEGACACLQLPDKKHEWCGPLHIVRLVRTVQPRITAVVTLESAKGGAK
jgi:hypothetical protein